MVSGGCSKHKVDRPVIGQPTNLIVSISNLNGMSWVDFVRINFIYFQDVSNYSTADNEPFSLNMQSFA